jgi:nucleoside-diphosphate-sugar epimerase
LLLMKIAVTGATGFVGRHLLPLLAQQNWTVRILARNPENFPAPGEMTFVRGDVLNREAVLQLCSGCEAVLHLAGAISGTAAHMTDVNGEGTRTVVAAAAEAGVRRFVFVSSLAAREPDVSSYGKSKASGELAVRLAPRELQTLIIRPPAVYGEGDVATLPLLKILMSQTAIIPGTATSRFSLIHAEDLARILVDAVSSHVEGLREVDDGHGGYTWAEVAQTARDLFGYPARTAHVPKALALALGYAAGGVARFSGRPGMMSADKMRQLYHEDWSALPPGWPREKPIALAEGLRRTLLWSMDKGMLPRIAPLDRRTTS